MGTSHHDTRPLEAAFRQTRAPFDVIDVAGRRARELYEHDLLLVRPDLHVVWRGNALPDDPDGLAAIATGQRAASFITR
jgi:hypothetical protein